MSATIIIVCVVAGVAGLVATLLTSANTGMPSKEVLRRAAQRSRELDARDSAERRD